MAAPVSTKPGWRFGVFEVDAHRGELRRSGVPLRVREQSFQILVALLENPGEIVTREELRHLLWPSDTFVDFDHSLNTAMMRLRDALGDSIEAPIYIETIPKRGYRFIAPVSPIANLLNEFTVRSETSVTRVTQKLEDAPSTAAGSTGSEHRVLPFLIAASCALLAVCGAAYLLRRWPPMQPDRSSEAFRIVPVTSTSGIAMNPALSPDGRAVAYIWDGLGRNKFDIYEQLIGGELPMRVTYEGGKYGHLAWSPDGREIVFTRCDANDNGAVYIVPALGGTERRLTAAGCQTSYPSDIAWSPVDDGQLVFIDRCSISGRFGIVSFSLKTGVRRCVTEVGIPGQENRYSFSLSRDGTRVAFIPSTDPALCEVYVVPIAGGVPKRIVHDEGQCLSLMWTPDDQAIVFYSVRATLESLWRVSAKGGEISKEPIFSRVGRFSADGRRFVYDDGNVTESLSIWRTDLSAPGGKPLATGRLIASLTSDLDAQPSPDGSRIAWMSQRTGDDEIWSSDANGGRPLQLTHLHYHSGTPRWSPDGNWIVFDSQMKGGPQIFMVDTEGRNVRQVTSGPFGNIVPSWSRDGKAIYFVSRRSGAREVWKHFLDSGREVQLTHHGGFDPLESYDGQTVYFSRFEQAGLWSVPSGGGAEQLVVPAKPQVGFWGHWAVTQSGLYVLNVQDAQGVSGYRQRRSVPHSLIGRRAVVEFYDFATRRTKPVFTLEKLPAHLQPSLSATRDGKRVFYTQFDFQSVIKMMEFQQ